MLVYFGGTLLYAAPQGYGGEYQKDDNFTAYEALVNEGITLIDTAEVSCLFRSYMATPCTVLVSATAATACWQVYGFGLSEEFLGDFMRQSGTQPVIATKFAPLPWRFTSGSVVGACRSAPAALKSLVAAGVRRSEIAALLP